MANQLQRQLREISSHHRWIFLSFATLTIIGGVLLQLATRNVGLLKTIYNRNPSDVYYIILLALLIGVIGLAMIYRKHARLIVEALFLFTIFLGTWYLCLSFFSVQVGLILASVLVMAALLGRRVAFHNVMFLVGSVGIALRLSGMFSGFILAFLVVGFCIYDIVMARPGGPMVRVVQSFLERGIVPGCILIDAPKVIWEYVDQAMKGRSIFLGSGDFVLPFMLTARAMAVSSYLGWAVICGMIVGMIALMASFKDDRPRPALPWLAGGAMIPYLIGYLLF